MKTKELIRRLQEVDPSGELECCVGNADILTVHAEVAYWDGCLQVLIRDPARAPYYDVVGAKYVSHGAKVVICPHSIPSALLDHPELPVDLSDLEESQRKRYEVHVATMRQRMHDINMGVEGSIFAEYMIQRLEGQHGEDFCRQEVGEVARAFFKENMSYLDEMPDDIRNQKLPSGGWPSWADRRRAQWDQEIQVVFDGAMLRLRKQGEP